MDGFESRLEVYQPMNAATDRPRARALLYDAGTRRWLAFSRPDAIVSIDRAEEAPAALDRVEAATQAGRWAFGFVSYEAARGFDRSLTTRRRRTTPHLWFAICDPPRSIATADLPAAPEFTLGALKATLDPAAHASGVARIHDAIARGDTYQVNYTYFLEGPFRGSSWGLFRRLWQNQPTAYSAWIDTGAHLVCSASPELFFELEGDRLVSRPMKGTARRGRTTVEDERIAAELADSEKNRAENVMIVDMVRNDLGRIAAPGSVVVSRLFEVERYPSVFQLTSTVEGRTDATLTEIFEALFPCASITGAPKRRTMEIITELEAQPRGIYTGAIGWIAPERRARFSVAIRTAVIDRATSTLRFGTGGGIVWDSKPKAEYRECVDKTRVLRRPAVDFALLETLLWSPGDGYRHLRRHVDRAVDSGIYFDIPVDVEQLSALLDDAAADWTGAQRVRITIGRDGAIDLTAVPFVPKPEPWRLTLAAEPVDAGDWRLFHKTTDRRIYEQAAATEPYADDVILWNREGELTETTLGNLIVELDDGLWTPPVESGLLAGTERAHLLAADRVGERVLPIDTLARCRATFVCNSVHGLVRGQIDEALTVLG